MHRKRWRGGWTGSTERPVCSGWVAEERGRYDRFSFKNEAPYIGRRHTLEAQAVTPTLSSAPGCPQRSGSRSGYHCQAPQVWVPPMGLWAPAPEWWSPDLSLRKLNTPRKQGERHGRE